VTIWILTLRCSAEKMALMKGRDVRLGVWIYTEEFATKKSVLMVMASCIMHAFCTIQNMEEVNVQRSCRWTLRAKWIKVRVLMMR